MRQRSIEIIITEQLYTALWELDRPYLPSDEYQTKWLLPAPFIELTLAPTTTAFLAAEETMELTEGRLFSDLGPKGLKFESSRVLSLVFDASPWHRMETDEGVSEVIGAVSYLRYRVDERKVERDGYEMYGCYKYIIEPNDCTVHYAWSSRSPEEYTKYMDKKKYRGFCMTRTESATRLFGVLVRVAELLQHPNVRLEPLKRAMRPSYRLHVPGDPRILIDQVLQGQG